MLSISDRGSRSHWNPLYDNYYFASSPPTRPAPVFETTRLAIRLRLWLRRAIKRINERTDKLRELGPDRPVVTCQIHTGISGHPPQISPARFGIRQSISPVDELKSRRPRKSQYRLTTLQIAYLELRVAMSVT